MPWTLTMLFDNTMKGSEDDEFHLESGSDSELSDMEEGEGEEEEEEEDEGAEPEENEEGDEGEEESEAGEDEDWDSEDVGTFGWCLIIGFIYRSIFIICIIICIICSIAHV